MDVSQLLWALLLLVIHGRPVWLQGTCDQCDCKLSSEEGKEDRAILSVKTRCLSGTIDWDSAYGGAIRLEVLPSLRAASYRLCLAVHSRHTVTLVSRETPQIPRHRNHRLGEEGRGSLSMEPLVRTSWGEEGDSPEACLTGRTGQSLWLFVEVQRTNRFTGIPSVTLKYDVEPVSDSQLLDPMEECRPCTQEELLDAYCTSDFVAVGTIHTTEEDLSGVTDGDTAAAVSEAGASGEERSTHIQVAVAQLVHQNSPVFRRLHRDDRFLYGTVHAPAKCGVRPGRGQFLFTGRMRLGKPKLRCAPFFEDWLKISAEAECVYD